jgi:hypothetical protein
MPGPSSPGRYTPADARERRIARTTAADDAAKSAAPMAISRALGPVPDAPPAPVCGAPEGTTLLAGGAMAADVLVVGVGVVELLGDTLWVADGVLLGDALGDVLGDMLVLGQEVGTDELVAYELPSQVMVTKID